MREVGTQVSTFPPIAQYGLLSNCEQSCLVAPDGAVEWLCLPRPDSPSVFAALLDRSAGTFRFGPSNAQVPQQRRYVPGTMVLETTWQTGTGWMTVQDFLAVGPAADGARRPEYHRAPTDTGAIGALVRIATCISGRAEVAVNCAPLFNYGTAGGTWNYTGEGYSAMTVAAKEGDVALELAGSIGLGVLGARGYGRTTLSGQHLRVAFPGDQRLDHVAGGQRGQRAGHGRDLDQRVFQQLFQPGVIPGALAGQVGAQPGVIPQGTDLGRRHERRAQHAPLGQLGQPHRIQLVGLRPARGLLDVTRPDQLHLQPGRLQQVEPDPPVVAGGFQGDFLDPLGGQVPAQLQHRIGGGIHLPHPGQPLTRPRRVRHPGAHHPRRLGHIDRGHPLQDLLMLLVGDLLRLPHHHTPSAHHQPALTGCPGASVRKPKS